jgi:DNA/RNA endonuclease YhcR with UshA esterase domain
MKVKELIRKLKEFDESLEVTITTVPVNRTIGEITIYTKDIEMYRGNLEVIPTPIVDVVNCVKDKKGKYLILDVNESDFYVGSDFSPR